ncbi:ccr4 associated factor [Tulasnella sp. 427]|nr:ccr4 associated factor [Tulasnella sp. 427]
MASLARSLLRSRGVCSTPRALSTTSLEAVSQRKYSSNGSNEVSRRCAPVPNRALVAVTGSQASTFLNGIITVPIPEPGADVWKTNGGGIYSAFLSAQGRIMYDIFIYPYIPKSPEEKSGYIVEYDPRAASSGDDPAPTQQASTKHPTPPLISMLKRYILRSKVRVRDVSENWDIWALWGSSLPQSVHDVARPDDWKWGRSGAVEPVYHDAQRTPLDRPGVQKWLLGQESDARQYGAEPVWMVDRRAPGMGIRALLPKGLKPIPSEDVASSDHYTLHRIKLGVPEGVDDAPTQDSFPMDANMDMMGGGEYETSLDISRRHFPG